MRRREPNYRLMRALLKQVNGHRQNPDKDFWYLEGDGVCSVVADRSAYSLKDNYKKLKWIKYE